MQRIMSLAVPEKIALSRKVECLMDVLMIFENNIPIGTTSNSKKWRILSHKPISLAARRAHNVCKYLGSEKGDIVLDDDASNTDKYR